VTSTARAYAGRTDAERKAQRRDQLLDAGLELMGTVGAGATTVRAVIETSGLAPRYFYETFAGIDELQVAVFDRVTAEAEQLGLVAMAQAGRSARSRVRAVLSAMVDLMLEDPRKGRVVVVEALGSPALGARRLAEVSRFAGLLAANSGDVWRGREVGDHAVRITTQFAIGGFAESLALVLQGQLEVDRATLVDDLTELFLGLGGSFGRLTTR
jgi:AcrR family transcriptional regulator